jgi:hypothetical protein
MCDEYNFLFPRSWQLLWRRRKSPQKGFVGRLVRAWKVVFLQRQMSLMSASRGEFVGILTVALFSLSLSLSPWCCKRSPFVSLFVVSPVRCSRSSAPFSQQTTHSTLDAAILCVCICVCVCVSFYSPAINFVHSIFSRFLKSNLLGEIWNQTDNSKHDLTVGAGILL